MSDSTLGARQNGQNGQVGQNGKVGQNEQVGQIEPHEGGSTSATLASGDDAVAAQGELPSSASADNVAGLFGFESSWVTAALVYAVLVLLVTWPLAYMIGDRFIGDFQGDFWKHSWGHWWVRESWVSGSLPLYCTYINAPSGGYLFIADPFNCLVVGLLLSCFSLVVSYNLLILLNVWAGCMAAWLLAKYVVGDGRAALFAGACYGLSAYVLAYPVMSGVTETLNTAWIPLFILFLLRTTDYGRLSDILCAAFFFALTTVSCWYYGEFMIVYTAVVVAHRFCRGMSNDRLFRWRWRSWRERESLRREVWQRAYASGRALALPFVKICLAIAMGLIMIAPFAVMFQLVVSDPANIVMPDKAPKRSLFRFDDFMGSNSPWSISARGVQGFHNYTNLLGFFLPGKGNATVTITIDRLTRVHYLGWIALAVGFISFRNRRRYTEKEQGEWRYWFWSGLFFLALSLGPRVVFSDFSPFGVPSPLYMAMFWFFPMFHKVAIPFRFLALGLLSLGVLGSLGLSKVLSRQTRLAALTISVAVPTAMVLEVALVSPLPWPIPQSPSQVPACYQMLARQPGEFSIIDYPFERPDTQLIPGEYFYYQTVHKHPIPYRTSGVLSPEVARSAFMEELSNSRTGMPSTFTSRENLRKGATSLRAMGFKYFILHQHLLPGGTMEQLEKALLPVLGEPARFADGVVVYEIKPIAEGRSHEP